MKWNRRRSAVVKADMIRRVPILTIVLALTAGCGGGAFPTTSQTSSPTSAPAATSMLRPADQAVVDAALADLSQRLSVPQDQIQVQSFSRVTWSDGSLGCPQRGEMYTQALVDGSRVILAHGGDTYDYHAGSDDQPFLCERPTLSSGPGLTVPTPSDR